MDEKYVGQNSPHRRPSSDMNIALPDSFHFENTINSHGWSDLQPFKVEENGFSYTVFLPDTAEAVDFRVVADGDGVKVKIETMDEIHKPSILAAVNRILRLDEDLEDFYKLAETLGYSHIPEMKMGRMIRSASVFEDMVKTVCTTNCTWGATRKMTERLVEKLGTPSRSGKRAFPDATVMAAQTEDFYREEIRAGYRCGYLLELAQKVVDGEIVPNSFQNTYESTPDLKKRIKKIKGFGDYAADNLLKLLGRYDFLALDSWLRPRFYDRYNSGNPCDDNKIERKYKKFGKWKGLALWCDLTREWMK